MSNRLRCIHATDRRAE